jgi:phosphatidate cytidylyltransferase
LTEKNRNLVVRAVTAIVLLPLVLWLLWAGSWWTAALLSAAAAVCASEYYLIVWKRLPPNAWVGIVGAGIMPLLPVMSDQPFVWSFAVVAVMFLFVWTYHLLRGPLTEAPLHAAHGLSGLVYGGLGLTTLAWLRLEQDTGLAWVVAALAITWGNDTCAYFAGRLLGRHKLYPAVSPNKTWEGFFGGLVGSVVAMALLKLAVFPFLTVADVLIVGVAGGIFGPIGDLVESMLKRAYGVKDSGRLIPGHGGLLDRVDALLFNAPMLFAYVWGVRPLLP